MTDMDGKKQLELKATRFLEAALDAKGIAHAKRVALLVPEKLTVVALLHDIVEDSLVTVEAIKYEFGEEVGVTVEALTRKPFPEETYAAYILRVALIPDAVVVKLADISDHLHGEATPPTATLAKRYKQAAAVLLEKTATAMEKL